MNKDGFLCVETPKLLKLGLEPDSVQQILKNAELRMSFGVPRPRRFAGRFAEFQGTLTFDEPRRRMLW
ncbi:MAG: hypothetical protein WAN75_45575 [Xanthobacteraceae bacterium]|jgi:hypothetical protein